MKYRFFFNGTSASCYALAAMIKDGWKITGTQLAEVDGEDIHWFILEK